MNTAIPKTPDMARSEIEFLINLHHADTEIAKLSRQSARDFSQTILRD